MLSGAIPCITYAPHSTPPPPTLTYYTLQSTRKSAEFNDRLLGICGVIDFMTRNRKTGRRENYILERFKEIIKHTENNNLYEKEDINSQKRHMYKFIHNSMDEVNNKCLKLCSLKAKSANSRIIPLQRELR